MFRLRDCPRQGQSQTIISRLLREDSGAPKKKKKLDKKEKGGKAGTRGSKRKFSETDEESVSREFSLKLQCKFRKKSRKSSSSVRRKDKMNTTRSLLT